MAKRIQRARTPATSSKKQMGSARLLSPGPWSSEAEQALLRGDADALVLNYARGFVGDLDRGELEFLNSRLRVRRLALLDRGIPDVRPIYRLSDTLEDLSIQASPKAELDLEELPRLQKIAGEWGLIGPALGQLLHLRQVSTWRFGEGDLTVFEAHTGLERLTVKDAPRLESLDGLANHEALTHLEIRGAKRLSDISVLAETQARLDELTLEGCRAIDSLESLRELLSLRYLGIGKCGDLPRPQNCRRS